VSVALPRTGRRAAEAPAGTARKKGPKRPRPSPSLVGRLVALAAAWSLAVLVAAGLALSAFFNQAELTRLDDILFQNLDDLVAGVSTEGGVITPPASSDQRTLRAYGGSYWQILTRPPAVTAAPGAAPPQAQMVRSRSLWDHALPLPPGGLEALAARPGHTVYYDGAGPLDQPLRIAAVEDRLPEVAAPVVFMAGEDRSAIDRAMRTFDTTIAVALVLLGVGLLVAVIVQVRVGLQPLFSLRREVAAIRTGRTERIAGRYPSELEPLAEELNALMAHTQEVVERQRTHVGNLAHALKTPLSVMLTEARQQEGPLSEVVIRQSQAMGQHVDHHLRRARAAAHAQGQGERTPVAPVLEDLSRTLGRIFDGKVASVDWECDEELSFRGERQDLLEIAGNVMENACKWAKGRVRAEAIAAGPRAFILTVEDDGAGLPADKREAVLERGARLDEQTPGSGLGLAIVDELVRAYGGRLDLQSSPLGGLKVVIELPRAEA
jgi:signal transduction histidine kinase